MKRVTIMPKKTARRLTTICLSGALTLSMGQTGRIDLLHCNNSRDEFGSARDRHAPVHEGTIEAQQLVAICAAANAPVVLETRPDSQAKDIAWLREHLDS